MKINYMIITKQKIYTAVLLLLFGISTTSIFQVNEVETIFIVELGKVVRSIDKAGLHLKVPIIQDVVRFDKRILQVDLPAKEVIASDQKRLVIDAYAKYKINNTKIFYESVRNQFGANNRIASILDSVMRQVVATYPLISLLSTDREIIMRKIEDKLNEQTKQFGIDIIDVRIIRADLPIENSDAIFKRMISDRQKEAQELRSQGNQEAKIIMAKADRKAAEIKSQALMLSAKIRGQADANAAKIYSSTFSKDPAFYEFYQKLVSYKAIEKNTIILGTKDNSFLDLIKKGNF
jgi:membrane protease subunit HflC